jgi:hypothetical protein
MADSGLKALDRSVAQMADDETVKIVEETDAQLFGIQNVGKGVDPLSAEVTKQVNNLADKKLAMEAGTIDPSHYYATIQAKVKELRTRYSGYGDQIDRALSSKGIDPNWQRKQILEEGAKAEARARAGTDATDRNNRELIEGILRAGVPMTDEMRARAVQPDAHKDPALLMRLKFDQSKWNQNKEVVQQNKLTYEMTDLADKDLGNNLEKAIGSEYTLTLTNVLKQLPEAREMERIQAQSAERTKRGESIPPEDIARLQGNIQAITQKLRAAKLEIDARYADKSGPFPEVTKRLNENFESTLDLLAKSAKDQNWGVFNYASNRVKNIMDNEKGDMLSGSADMRKLAATSDLYGQAGVDKYFATVPTALSSLQKQFQ